MDCSLKKIDKRRENFQKKLNKIKKQANYWSNALKHNGKKNEKKLSELWSNPTSV